MTPAIFHGEELDNSARHKQPSSEEDKIRQKALKAFEQAGSKEGMQAVDRGITDNLLNF